MEIEKNRSVFKKKGLLNAIILLKMYYKNLEIGLIGGGAGKEKI